MAKKTAVKTSKRSLNVSPSSIGEWVKCRWRYALRYVLGLRPARGPSSRMIAGKIFHNALELWYSTPSRRGKMQRVLGQMADEIALMPSESRDSVERYLHWVEANVVDGPVLATEFAFSLPLDAAGIMARGYPATRGMRIQFSGVMDLLTLHGARVEIWDHKLQTNAPSRNAMDHIQISYPQLGLYPLASGWLGRPIWYSMLNVMAERRSREPVVRVVARFGKPELASWETYLMDMTGEIATATTLCSPPDLVSLARPAADPWVKSLGSLYCDNCEFAELCLAHHQRDRAGVAGILHGEFTTKPEKDGKPKTWHDRFPDSLLKAIPAGYE